MRKLTFGVDCPLPVVDEREISTYEDTPKVGFRVQNSKSSFSAKANKRYESLEKTPSMTDENLYSCQKILNEDLKSVKSSIISVKDHETFLTELIE